MLTNLPFTQRSDNAVWYKYNGLLRTLVVLGLNRSVTRPVILTEYPKSGGTWLSQMISEVLGIPYPRNRLPYVFEDQVIHGCYRRIGRLLDTVVVWRDGRDTMVSYYYHLCFDKPVTSAMAGNKLRSELGIRDPEDIQKYLPRFIEWAFNGGYPRFTWADFVNHWHGRTDVAFTSYEAVTEDPKRELRKVLEFFDRIEVSEAQLDAAVEKYSFQNQTNRRRGEADPNSFVRKGIVGDWKNVFDRECREIFHGYAGSELILLGYEADDSWVRQTDDVTYQ